MLEVEIRNFQSIEHAIVQVDGFTALVGRSNIGKSAIVRAVKAALTGAPADAYVRHDIACTRTVRGTKTCKCSCSVHIRAEGFDLFWEKGDDKNRYIYNGQEYTVPGKGTPDFLEDRFGLVKIGDQKVLIQIADQFRHSGGGPIFLLDESGSVVADVLSDVAQLDRINIASRLAEKDRREAVASRKVREKDVMDLKVQVMAFDGLNAVLARVRGIETDEQRLEVRKEQRDELLRFRDSVLTVGREVKSLSGIVKIVIPEIKPVIDRQAQRIQLGLYVSSVAEKESTISRLVGIEEVSAPEINPLLKGQEDHRRLDGWLTKLRVHKALFAKWKDVEAKLIPDLSPLSALAQNANLLESLRGKQASLEKLVTTLEAAYATVSTEMDAIKVETDALGACPTCARPLTEAGHEHSAE